MPGLVEKQIRTYSTNRANLIGPVCVLSAPVRPPLHFANFLAARTEFCSKITLARPVALLLCGKSNRDERSESKKLDCVACREHSDLTIIRRTINHRSRNARAPHPRRQVRKAPKHLAVRAALTHQERERCSRAIYLSRTDSAHRAFD